MKTTPGILILLPAAFCALGFGFWLSRRCPAPPAAAHNAGPVKAISTARSLPARPAGNGGEAPAGPAFWTQAEVPVPSRFREAAGVDPAALGVSQEIPPIDFPAELARLERTEDSKALNSLLLDWLTLDTDAARAWLEEAESLAPYQTALRLHAGRLATGGDCAFALRWTEFLDSPEQRESLVADIYSRGFQNGQFSRGDVEAAPIPEAERGNILNGSRRN